jgi:AhpD family alkylhydroperoxidase
MRLGLDEAGVTELVAVTEHAASLAVVAGALLLDGEATRAPLVEPVDGAGGPVLAEVRAWAREALGAGEAPLLWRILARNPHHLEATWRKDQVVMRDGALGARDKRRVALAVSMNARCRSMIEYHAAVLRRGGADDGDLLEILGVVDHYNSLNTLSDGMQIESDIRPPA